jgi:2-dehydro-3-deoxyphosphogluconate aldolase/(4S)-4-hydroxy-2-oxoglutarate aldolase
MVMSADADQPPTSAERVFESLRRCGVLPVVRLPTADLAVPLAQVILDAGLGAIEITFRAAGAADAIRAIRRDVPSILVGAGTVLTTEQAAEALDAGAAFVVAPATNARVIDYVMGRDTPMIPGVATPTEIDENVCRGLQVLKFFPAIALGGFEFLESVRGPYPTAKFIPTGGVSLATLAAFLALPNVVACGGTWIAPYDVLTARALDRVAGEARAAADVVRARPAAASRAW